MSATLVYLFCVLVVIVLSTVLHELAHGVVAFWLGDETAKQSGRLSLNPIKHIDPFMSILLPLMLGLMGGPIFGGAKPVPINTRNLKRGEWGFALVAIAGPLTNFLLALICFLIGYYTGAFTAGEGSFWSTFWSIGVAVNLGFMLFNIIPIPPLDGSRVLYVFAPVMVQEFFRRIEQYGTIIILILVWGFGTAFSVYMSEAMRAILDFFYFLVGAN